MNIKKDSIVHNDCDFTKQIYQMRNQVPNLPVSIDVRLINIKTIITFFVPGLYSSLLHALHTRSAEQISRNDASGHLIKWAHFLQNIIEITPSKT